jgi:hypothetical protein
MVALSLFPLLFTITIFFRSEEMASISTQSKLKLIKHFGDLPAKCRLFISPHVSDPTHAFFAATGSLTIKAAALDSKSPDLVVPIPIQCEHITVTLSPGIINKLVTLQIHQTNAHVLNIKYEVPGKRVTIDISDKEVTVTTYAAGFVQFKNYLATDDLTRSFLALCQAERVKVSYFRGHPGELDVTDLLLQDSKSAAAEVAPAASASASASAGGANDQPIWRSPAWGPAQRSFEAAVSAAAAPSPKITGPQVPNGSAISTVTGEIASTNLGIRCAGDNELPSPLPPWRAPLLTQCCESTIDLEQVTREAFRDSRRDFMATALANLAKARKEIDQLDAEFKKAVMKTTKCAICSSEVATIYCLQCEKASKSRLSWDDS